jgi:hypothetical protein
MKKLLAAAFSILLIGSAHAVNFSSYWGSINVNDYTAGACSGAPDDTCSIQAAIDAAYAAQIQTVYIPPRAACYVTSVSLFLDKPNNLRGSRPAYAAGTTYAANDTVTYLGVQWTSIASGNVGHTPSASSTFWRQSVATSSTSAFSLTLQGDIGGEGNHEGWGTRICPTFNNSVALWVGPGRGMGVKSIQVIGPAGTYRGNQNSLGVGIAVSANSSRTVIQGTEVNNYYICYGADTNAASLGDSISWIKPVCDNAYYGWYIASNENDILDIYEPTVSATVAFASNLSRQITITGGNPSATAGVSASFAISGVSAVTGAACASPYGNYYCYTFTATVAAPDAYVGTVYNSYMLATPSFGVVPVQMTNFNAGVGTFQILRNWGAFHFQQQNAITQSDLGTEISALTTIYATERVTVLQGKAFSWIGGHVENPLACTTLLDTYSTFSGDNGVDINRVFFNYDPSLRAYRPQTTPTAANLGRFYCQQSFPFIDASQVTVSKNIIIKNSSLGQSNFAYDPLIIDWVGAAAEDKLEFARNSGTIVNPAVRSVAGLTGATMTGGYTTRYPSSIGAGEWDMSPFKVTAAAAGGGNYQNDWLTGLGTSPYVGCRPAPWAQPRLAVSLLTTLQSIAGVVLGHYPVVDGSTVYSVVDWNSGTLTNTRARSAHKFASYGQNLTTTNVGAGLAWSAKGQSFVVNLDAAGLSYMFNCLGVLLNTSANTHYVINGVFPSLGYITVMNAEQDGTPFLLAGTKTTTYTGTLIGQDAYSWTQYP